MTHLVYFEAVPVDGEWVFRIVFRDTGEIRTKVVSAEWLMKRVFQSELKTWRERDAEALLWEKEEWPPQL